MDKRSPKRGYISLGVKRRAVLKERSPNTSEDLGRDVNEADTSELDSMEILCEGDTVDKPAVRKEVVDIVEDSEEELHHKPVIHREQGDVPEVPEKELHDQPMIHKEQIDVPDELKEKPPECTSNKISNFDQPSTSTSNADEVEASQVLPDLSPSKLINQSEAEFQALVDKFIYSTRNEDLIKTLLQITVISDSQRFIECPLYQTLTTRTLRKVKVCKSKKDLMLCQAMFLAKLSTEEKLSDNKEKFDLLKDFLLSYFKDVSMFSQEYFNMEIDDTTITDFPETVKPLIDFILSENPPLAFCFDKRKTFPLLCAAAVKVILSLNENPVDDVMFHFEFCKSLIKRIEFFQGFCEVQSLDLEDPTNTRINIVIMIFLSDVELCSDLLKIALFNEPLKKLVIRFSDLLLLKKLQWVLDYCMEHAFVTPSEDFAVELKTTIMAIVKILGVLASIAYDDDDLTSFGAFFMEKLLLCITLVQFTGFEENNEFKIYSLEVCLLMMQNNWVTKDEFCKAMLMQTVTEPGLLIANELIQELEFSLRTIKFLESIEISSSLSEEGLSFLQRHAPYADVEKLGILHLDHCFTAAYVSVLLAMFCEGKMSHQRVLRNSISTTEAQACIGVLEKIKEFIAIVDDSPHPIDVSLLDQSAIVIRSVFYTAGTSSQ